MSQFAKRALFAAGYYTRALRRDRFPGVAVLCYHSVRAGGQEAPPFAQLHVTAAQLAAHCRWLAAACHPISLDDLRRARFGGGGLPDRPVLVTFDDGYRSVLTRALPVLERFGVPAAVFACTGPIARQHRLWYDALADHAGAEAVERAKALPHAEWRQLTAVEEPADVSDPHGPMTESELRTLAAHPLIEVGGHTVRHPILAQAPLAVQRAEVGECRTTLESWLGRPVRAFAYPNGLPGRDFTGDTVGLVGEAGYDLGFTTEGAFSRTGDPPLTLPRFVMLDSVTDSELAHRLTHSWRT
jgi:peptidoglycan/xylan/chitin deacetylase (PgdA/CDA1 family)